jgi:cobalt-zinc-cadmium efflux system outer membrane protein
MTLSNMNRNQSPGRCAVTAILLAAGLLLAPGRANGQQASSAQTASTKRITLEEAIQAALENNPALKAARTQIDQNKAQEITAAIRPNPVLAWDALFLPVLNPSNFNGDYLNNTTEFDVSGAYTIERGHKRQARITAARDQTTVTTAQVRDTERALSFSVAQQFIGALQAKSTLQLAEQNLSSFQQTIDISNERYRAGQISEGDLLKIKIQMLQFQTDLSSARLALAQAMASLRQQVGYQALPADYDVVGDLAYQPVPLNREDLQARALEHRPDLAAAKLGITAAQSQFHLAKANAKRDLTSALQYSHVAGANNLGVLFNIELPVFDRNQGEIARTQVVVTQSEHTRTSVEETVMTDVSNAYEGFKTSEKIVQLYESGYLKQAQDSRDISEYAYRRGAASLLDFLDSERSYRAAQLAYRQALANHMLAVEQLRQVVGTRNLP